MDNFIRKHLHFFHTFWNKCVPNGASSNPSFETWEPIPGYLHPTLDPDPAEDKASLRGVLYNYTAKNAEELSVTRGDKLYVLKEEGGYVLARRFSGDRVVGYVPASYISKGSEEPASHQSWYINGITRNKANQLLLSPPNHHGSFLIRDSESNKGEYSLSVRNHGKVRHFRIYSNPAGSFYLEKAHVFLSLEELLAYYRANWKIIQCPLSQPCVQKRTSEMDQWERPRSEFHLWRKMGEGCFGEVWEGMWKNTVPVAIKIMKQASFSSSSLNLRVKASPLPLADHLFLPFLQDDIYSTTGSAMIPVKWTAPEAAIYQTYSPKSDAWSYGILLYEVFSYGQCPYDGMTNQETIQQITRGYRLPRPNSCSPEVYSIMLECWKAHPEDRPTFLNLRDALFSIYKWARHSFS
ncbi:tyrosine-protein kinase Srms [Notechis scutatus]|uniref:Tyrosine-protein kinase n=1 Tax=Notechis scutatus TaxID=8663 RepID=A0A6J1VUH6_9SAUR|nr:tyrosine-protein kinase Srms [Notechis scutatus]